MTSPERMVRRNHQRAPMSAQSRKDFAFTNYGRHRGLAIFGAAQLVPTSSYVLYILCILNQRSQLFSQTPFTSSFQYQRVHRARRDDKKKSDVIPRYTNGGKSQVRNGSSQRCTGWTVEGTKRYGQLYCLAEKERATVSRQEFEEDYLKKKKEEFENERALRKKRLMDRDEAR